MRMKVISHKADRNLCYISDFRDVEVGMGHGLNIVNSKQVWYWKMLNICNMDETRRRTIEPNIWSLQAQKLEPRDLVGCSFVHEPAVSTTYHRLYHDQVAISERLRPPSWPALHHH